MLLETGRLDRPPRYELHAEITIMRSLGFTALSCFAALACFADAPSARAERQLENLSRGIVALPAPEGCLFVSWRLFGTYPAGIAFNLYRHQGNGPAAKVNAEPLAGAT